jgi:hypothetical protein
MDCIKCDACGRIWETRSFGNGPHQLRGKHLDLCDECLKVVEKAVKEAMSFQYIRWKRKKNQNEKYTSRHES